MSKSFKLLLSSPDAVLFDGEVDLVTVTTPNGEIGIMADHEPLVSLICPGLMKIHSGKEEKLLATGGGFIKTNGSIAKVFAQTAEYSESIDEKRAHEAMQQAQDIMKEKIDEISLADATALLERNIARLKVVGRKKKYKN